MARNIVVLCLDSVRKDYFDEYASRLTGLSDVSFEQCRVAAPWSFPSHASILSGKLPHQHGIHQQSAMRRGRDMSDLNSEKTFLSDLDDHEKISITANQYIGSPFGADSLFDDVIDIAPQHRFPEGIDIRNVDTDSDGIGKILDFLSQFITHENTFQSVANGLLFKLDVICNDLPIANPFDDGANPLLKQAASKVKDTDAPFFLFINLMDAHGPLSNIRGFDQSLHSVSNTWSTFELPTPEINANGVDGYEEDLKKWRELYSASIEYLDRKVASFVETVQEMTSSETTFIITADHGENLGYPAEDYLIGHNSSLSEGLLHVPLNVINPPSGYRDSISAYVTHLDLGDLIIAFSRDQTLDISRETIGAEFIGGFYPRFRRNGPHLEEEQYRYLDRMIRCAYSETTKYVWTSLGESFKYELDPERPSWQKETEEDVSVPRWAKELFDTPISGVKKPVSSEAEYNIDESTRSRLEELGYV